jgi:adenosine deaminase
MAIDPHYPLVELHRHLDGSVRLETILDLGLQYNLPLPARDLAGLRPHVQVTEQKPGVLAFLEKFEWFTKILVNYDAVRRVAWENVADAAREGIDHIELRFSPWFMAEANHLNPAGVVEAVIDGVAAGRRDFGISVGLIGILSRTYGPQIAWQELDALLTFKTRLVGLDLAGDEAHWPGDLFVAHLAKARAVGWQITIHAGESAGAASVWQAIQHLGANRLGHAVRAIDDPRLMDELLRSGIGIESNLTSNVQTTTVTDYAAHPLSAFLAHGLLASLNTDDPGISGIDLHYEYEVAAPAAGLSPAQINQAQRNALQTAFLSSTEKQHLLDQKGLVSHASN